MNSLGISWRQTCIVVDTRSVFASGETAESFGMARSGAACRLAKGSTEYSARWDRTMVTLP
jgi:hypothetical protein